MAGAPLGNKNGAKGKLWEGAIRRAIAQRQAGGLDAGLEALAGKLVTAAENGDQWALIEIGNRMDGKPAQVMTVAGDDENPLQYNHTVEFIGASEAAKET